MLVLFIFTQVGKDFRNVYVSVKQVSFLIAPYCNVCSWVGCCVVTVRKHQRTWPRTRPFLAAVSWAGKIGSSDVRLSVGSRHWGFEDAFGSSHDTVKGTESQRGLSGCLHSEWLLSVEISLPAVPTQQPSHRLFAFLAVLWKLDTRFYIKDVFSGTRILSQSKFYLENTEACSLLEVLTPQENKCQLSLCV